MTKISFQEAINKYNSLMKKQDAKTIDSIVPVHGKFKKEISIRSKHGSFNEEYYKWQFITSLVRSGLFNKEYIGVEVYFPKGNPSSTPLKMDGAIFDSKDWVEHYNNFWKNKNQNDLDWLRKHLIVVIEFKDENGYDIEKYYNQQLKPAMKESERDFVVGIYYDDEKLWIFKRENGKYLRFDDSKNISEESGLGSLSLNLTDDYSSLPSFNNIIEEKSFEENVSNRNVDDLELISGINSTMINTKLSNITFTLDKVSLDPAVSYRILIETIALKIFDEKNNSPLEFYIKNDEKNYSEISEDNVQNFIKRINNILNNAKTFYHKILEDSVINWKDEAHVKTVMSIIENFQDYSFTKSYKTDLYQLVFYKFSNAFAKEQKGQFLTPINLIDFLVKIVNPHGNDRIIDPCAGISDFLSLSYVNSEPTLKDYNLYGMDNDKQMIMLSQLNMLLNGDGNAKIEHVPNHGSLNHKFNNKGEVVTLNHKYHKNGNWDNWADKTELMKYDVVLTNPPFGKGRDFKPETEKDKQVANLYELWDENKNKSIDMGILFLENAVRLLDTNGRFGIVLSNSIASVNRHEKEREWLMNNVRIVALFELPTNVFADTNVNTVMIVGYKPEKAELDKLKNEDYEIFAKTIENVGYEVKTVKKVKIFKEKYKIDKLTFEVLDDEDGNHLLDEDFTSIISEFKEWVITQEETLKNIFLGDSS